jgi:endonuclease YncB( thermonuclease family)
VLVDQDGKQMFDRYGRMIAVVYCDGALLNAELLFAGHAVIMKGFCKASEFGDEDWAKLFGC